MKQLPLCKKTRNKVRTQGRVGKAMGRGETWDGGNQQRIGREKSQK